MNPLKFFLDNRVKVFPVVRGKKAPAVPAGTSWADWDDFKRTRPASPYGVVLGKLTVVDGDSPEAVMWIRCNLPETPFRVQTGPYHEAKLLGRGVHFYFRTPDGPMLPSYIRRNGLAIEARRQDQYVLGPGSLHPSGCTYKPTEWSWRWEDLPVFPADLKFDDGTCVTSTIDGTYTPPNGEITSGERTDALFRYLRHMKARNTYPMDVVREYVWAFNQTRCTPPKSRSWFESWFTRSWNHYDRPDFGQPFEALPSVPAPTTFDFTPEVRDGE